MRKKLFWLTVWVTALLLLLFVVFCAKDTIYYNAAMNSAPLRVFYLVRVIEFALPAAICGGAAWILKKKK